MITDRQAMHRTAVKRLRDLLQRKGYQVDPGLYPHGELRVEGLRVALRAGRAVLRKHTVRSKAGGTYRYTYSFFALNFHQHGKYPADPPDVWVGAWALANRRWRFFILPESAVHGTLTMGLCATTPAGGRSILARVAGRWEVFAEVAAAKKARAA